MNKKDLIDLIDSVIRKLERKTDLVSAQGELKTVRYWLEKDLDEERHRENYVDELDKDYV